MLKFSGPAVFPLSALTLDPGLQCREAIDPDVVNEYAELIRNGTQFPAVRAIAVAGDDDEDGVVLLVDGFHRYEAHVDAGGSDILVEVAEGTRRDAMIEAAKANTNHGLRRTTLGKRRAVRLLLRDVTCCHLSGRELATMSGTSHTFVNETRSRYGVVVGEQLSDRRIADVEGEPTAEWVALRSAAPTWYRGEVERMRIAPTPSALVGIRTNGEDFLNRAWETRAEEFATGAWPLGLHFPEFGETVLQCAELDTVANLEAVLRSCVVSGMLLSGDHLAERVALRSELYRVLKLALEIPGLTIRHPEHEALLKARAKLHYAWSIRMLELAEAKKKADAKPRVKQDYEVVDDIVHEGDVLAQAKMVAEASLGVFNQLWQNRLTTKMTAFVRDGAFKARMEKAGALSEEVCHLPWCGGWLGKGGVYGGWWCAHCGTSQEDAVATIVDSLRTTGKLLSHRDFAFRMETARGVSVVVDHHMVAIAAELEVSHRTENRNRMDAWLAGCPSKALAAAIQAQRVAELPATTVNANAAAEPVEGESEDDENDGMGWAVGDGEDGKGVDDGC